MKQKKTGLLLAAAVFSATISTRSGIASNVASKIAEAMREYQGRYIYIWYTSKNKVPDESDYLSWPAPCGCSSLRVPYPPSNYYKYSADDPSFKKNPNAIFLVRDIVTKFWHIEGEKPPALYNRFIHTYWDPDELAYPPVHYSPSDFPYIPQAAGVNASNYEAVLNVLLDAIKNEFKYISVGGITTTAKKMRDGGVGCPSGVEDCDEAKTEAENDWEGCGWQDPCEGSDPDCRVLEETSRPDGYDATLDVVRMKLECDLTYHTGTARFYVQISKELPFPEYPAGQEFDNWSNMESGWDTPPANADYWWQPWESVAVGAPRTSGYLANYMPLFTSWCPEDGETNGWKYQSACVLVQPIFETSPSGWFSDNSDLDIYKTINTVYAANPDCDKARQGETVDGNVVPEPPVQEVDLAIIELLADYNDQVAKLYVDGCLLTDPDKQLCICGSVVAVPFSVKAVNKMAAGAREDISFRVILLRKDESDNIYCSEKNVSLQVKPNLGDICCMEEPCIIATLEIGGIKLIEFCAYRTSAQAWDWPNGDIEVFLPDRLSERLIVDGPRPGFLQGWGARKVGNEIIVTYELDGVIYEFVSGSPYRLTSKKDLEGNELVTFEYDEYGRLNKQKDAANPDYYILYDYNDLGDFNDYPETIIGQADDVNRVYTIEYDGMGRVVAVTNGSCGCGGGAVRYAFDENDFIKQERSYDTNEVIYEYVRDSRGRILEKWLGAKDANNCVQKTVYTENSNGATVDTYDYVDANSYRVTREHRNAAGLVTKRIEYENLNEDPNSPAGRSFIEHIVYYYDANNIVIKEAVIPPKGDSNDPDPNLISGIRKEYTYDPNAGRMLTEKWFDTNDANFAVISYTYECLMDGNNMNVRVLTSKDARGSVTQYFYDGNSLDPNLKTMPQVSAGISDDQQLKYEYAYDPNRNWLILERQLDINDVLVAQTEYIYNSYGNLMERRDYRGDGNEITEYEYNGFNEMIKTTLPSGVVHGWSYNDAGKVGYEVIYDPCDPNYAYSQTSYSYDENARLIEVAKAIDANVFPIDYPSKWVYTKHEYDVRGNKVKVIEDANGLKLQTTYEYDNQNGVTKITLPNGKWTKTYRDGRGLVSKTEVGYGSTTIATTEFLYDDNGNLAWQKAPDDIWTKYEYDDFDRLIKVTRGL
jgi:YD repeat-containing protein